ncbi:hypothetical protein ACHAXS_012194 [Conticribra weissflogii]
MIINNDTIQTYVINTFPLQDIFVVGIDIIVMGNILGILFIQPLMQKNILGSGALCEFDLTQQLPLPHPSLSALREFSLILRSAPMISIDINQL